jgi:hypothetical protein
MSNERLRSIVEQVVQQVVRGDYDDVIRLCHKSRVTSEQLARVVHEYGRKLAMPPRDAYRRIDAVKVTTANVPTWSVRVPLWTQEEGMSDLTLELTVTLGSGEPSIELDDLHVL